MKNFMQTNFNIEKIVLACEVIGASATTTHISRPSHGLVYFLGAHEYYFSDGMVLRPNANDILYLPKNSSYSVKTIGKSGCFAINFDFTNPHIFTPFVVNLKNQTLLENFNRAKNAWIKKTQGYEMKCKAELYNVIYAIQQEFAADYMEKNKLSIINPAVKFIHDNYTKQLISIEELAKICKITPEYFRKIFKYFFGTSPINYVNNLKIQHAKELLSSGEYSVTEAAFNSGFPDTSYFSRIFKKVTGKSPSKY